MKKKCIANLTIAILIVISLLWHVNISYASSEKRLTPHPGSRVGWEHDRDLTVIAGECVETNYWIYAPWQGGTARLIFFGWADEIYPLEEDVKPLPPEIKISMTPESVYIMKGENRIINVRIETSYDLKPGIYWIQGQVILEGVDKQVTEIRLEVTEGTNKQVSGQKFILTLKYILLVISVLIIGLLIYFKRKKPKIK